MKYLLDTNICIHFLNGNKKIADCFKKAGAEKLAITTSVLAELYFGAYNSAKAKENLDKIDLFKREIEIFSDSEDSAKVFGQLKAELRRIGKPTQDFDLLIAAIAISRGFTIATGNIRHFENIPHLKLKNWLAD